MVLFFLSFLSNEFATISIQCMALDIKLIKTDCESSNGTKRPFYSQMKVFIRGNFTVVFFLVNLQQYPFSVWHWVSNLDCESSGGTKRQIYSLILP